MVALYPFISERVNASINLSCKYHPFLCQLRFHDSRRGSESFKVVKYGYAVGKYR